MVRAAVFFVLDFSRSEFAMDDPSFSEPVRATLFEDDRADGEARRQAPVAPVEVSDERQYEGRHQTNHWRLSGPQPVDTARRSGHAEAERRDVAGKQGRHLSTADQADTAAGPEVRPAEDRPSLRCCHVSARCRVPKPPESPCLRATFSETLCVKFY